MACLPFDINLICPIFLDIDKVWVDYSNPNQPLVINKEEIDTTSTAYKSLKKDSFIKYNTTHFRMDYTEEFPYVFGHAGIPEWIQYPDIPRCPKTKETMKFLCQLKSEAGILVNETNIDHTID
mgnify:FL=1